MVSAAKLWMQPFPGYPTLGTGLGASSGKLRTVPLDQMRATVQRGERWSVESGDEPPCSFSVFRSF